MIDWSSLAYFALVSFAALYVIFYFIILINNIMGERFERSLHKPISVRSSSGKTSPAPEQRPDVISSSSPSTIVTTSVASPPRRHPSSPTRVSPACALRLTEELDMGKS